MTNDHTYVKPSDVHSPKRHWSLVHVLFDGGEDRPDRPDKSDNTMCSSLAMGLWDSKPVLALRWNGGKENPLGNPQSRGLPTWFIVPELHWTKIVEAYKFSDDKTNFIRNFLESKRVYFFNHCPNPACREYRELVLHEYRMNELGSVLEKLKRDELRFYHIICDHFWKPGPQEKNDLAAALQPAWDNHRREANK
jgi:hypothetical protein